jgi:hypothetical protein
MPTISYYDFYEWDAINREYEGFNYFADGEGFSDALQERSLFVLTITPDVYQYEEPSFQSYIQDNFAFLCSEGVYDFYLNQTIFDKAPNFCKYQAFLILKNFENSPIAPAEICQTVMNLSSWYRITNRTQFLGESVINEHPQNFSIDNDQVCERSVTIEVSLINKFTSQAQTIISLDDAANIRYGDSKDIYLELFSADGYRWISGVDISKFSWQNLTITFVYDADSFRAEIYINGILMSSEFKGVDGNSFSSLCFAGNNLVKTCVNSDNTDIYSIKIWNHALSGTEINAKETVSSLVFSEP